MKSLFKVSLMTLSFLMFGGSFASDQDKAFEMLRAWKAAGKLVRVESNKSSSTQSENTVKKALNKGKEKAEEEKDAMRNVKNKVENSVSEASGDPWAKLAQDYKNGKLSHWKPVEKDKSSSSQSEKKESSSGAQKSDVRVDICGIQADVGCPIS